MLVVISFLVDFSVGWGYVVQEAHCKDNQQASLLTFWNGHAGHHRDGQDKDDKVGDDVQVGDGPPEFRAMAASRNGTVP